MCGVVVAIIGFLILITLMGNPNDPVTRIVLSVIGIAFFTAIVARIFLQKKN